MSSTKLTPAATNVRNTYTGGIRTGRQDARPPVAPVTIYQGPGPTSLPHTLDKLAPAQHPEPSTTIPSMAKCAAIKAALAAKAAANQRRREQRAARKVARPAPVRVQFDNSRYERSHGTAPRGAGLWFFERAKGEPVFQFNGLLSAAKAAARKWAAAQDFGKAASILLYVCP